MVAPYLTPDRMLEFGGFAAHYEAWRQYEAAKGEDAPSLQETIDPTVLSIWGRRHGITFTGSTKRLDSEFGIWNLEFIKTLDAKEPRALLT